MEAWHQAQANRRPLLLYVSMPGCTYCRKMERDTLSHPAIAQQIGDSFVAARFDGRANANFARRLGVTAFPTTVIIAPENRMLDSIRGYASPEQLQARFTQLERTGALARRPTPPGTATR